MAYTIQSSIHPSILAQIGEVQRRGGTIHYGECLAVHWAQPTGTKYYSYTRFDLAPNLPNWPWKPVELRLRTQTVQDEFGNQAPGQIAFRSTHEISDDTIQLEFLDYDLAISELFELHPEGARVELLGYVATSPESDPQITQALPPLWWGILNAPDSITGGLLRTTATFGYRSAQGQLPSRYMSRTGCAAFFPPEHPSFTLETIADNDCPYDVHLGGSVGNVDPATNLPYTSCPKNSRTVCTARIGDSRSFLAFDSILSSETVGTGNNSTQAKTRGNESNLNTPCQVVIGEREVRELPVLTYQIQVNNNKPAKGTVSCIFPVSDSSVQSITEPKINDVAVTVASDSKNQFSANLGARRQSPLNLTKNTIAQNYSGVAHWRGLIFGDFAGRGAGDFRGSCKVEGNNEIRVYTDAHTYTKQYTQNRAWGLLWLLTNRRAGDGESEQNYVLEDWIELAARCDDSVGYSDATGAHFTGTRSTLNAQLEGRQTQQVIRDLCLAGRFSVPFAFEGKKRIILLKDEVITDDIPVIWDETNDGLASMGTAPLGAERTFGMVSISKLRLYDTYTQVTVWFEDKEFDYIRRPLVFAYPELQEARAKALGDTSQRIVNKEVTALGVVHLGEAVRVGNMVGDLGEFDAGGPKNPVRVTFRIKAISPVGLTLHPYKVIKVVSRWLAPYREQDADGIKTGRPVEYFRVLSLEKDANGFLTVTAQHYNRSYYERLEDATQPPPRPGSGGTAKLAEETIG